MLLDRLQTEQAAGKASNDCFRLMETMFPICRSITGEGVRRTLDLVDAFVPLTRFEITSGTSVFDWEVPPEWNIRDAYIADQSGNRIVDFRRHNLHVVSYSVPVHRPMMLSELQPHLHSLPDLPDAIPYRTSYYREDWGFCLRHRDRELLGPGPYDVLIDATLCDGSLTYAECTVPGSSGEEAVVYTHTCHPSLANDNLTGIAVAATLARQMRLESPRLTWRFVFGPGTIGSLAWLSQNESQLGRLRNGLVLGSLGDGGTLTYKRSRSGSTVTDRAAAYALASGRFDFRVVDFEPYGYDERQFCSPGFDLPVGRLTRSANGTYREYHTSADDLSFVSPVRLAESIRATARAISVIDGNRRLLNLCSKGEPRLGKRGLYGSVGGTAPRQFEHALLWVLSLADGDHDLVATAERSSMPLELLVQAASTLESAGLVRSIDESSAETAEHIR